MTEKIYYIPNETATLLFFAAIDSLANLIPCFIGTKVEAESVILCINARTEGLATIERYLAPFV